MNNIKTDKPIGIREGEELDILKLQKYLSSNLSESSNIKISQFPNGFSNLTYLIKQDKTEYILRRGPHGATIKSGHDMHREFKILTKLKQVYNKVPKTIHYCEDKSIIGVPFYLMERVKGVILRVNNTSNKLIKPELMAKIADSFIENFNKIHSVDIYKTKLNEIGKAEGYNKRQIEGWVKRYDKSKVDDFPLLEKTAKWLYNNIPNDDLNSLIHNDYKYDNIVLDTNDLSQIRSVLDWEMCTIGNPLMDLGTTLGYWTNHNDSDLMKKLNFNPSSVIGNPTREELVHKYSLKSNKNINNIIFYYVYGVFKISVIVQQIYYRYKLGLTKDKRFEKLDVVINDLALVASQAIERKKLDNLF
jgi:aminoglycoside phosphotransferase (APT) family kinase protein